MLAIRMQRTGRKGHAMFRMVVQESQLAPSSGKFVALVGNYDPHSKVLNLNKEKVAYYLNNGAQPSDRAARLIKQEGVKLPKWVNINAKKQGKLKNPDKLRKNRPAEEKPAQEETKAEEPAIEAEGNQETPQPSASEPAESAPANESATAEEPASGEAEPAETPTENTQEAEEPKSEEKPQK